MANSVRLTLFTVLSSLTLQRVLKEFEDMVPWQPESADHSATPLNASGTGTSSTGRKIQFRFWYWYGQRCAKEMNCTTPFTSQIPWYRYLSAVSVMNSYGLNWVDIADTKCGVVCGSCTYEHWHRRIWPDSVSTRQGFSTYKYISKNIKKSKPWCFDHERAVHRVQRTSGTSVFTHILATVLPACRNVLHPGDNSQIKP